MFDCRLSIDGLDTALQATFPRNQQSEVSDQQWDFSQTCLNLAGQRTEIGHSL